MLLSLFWPSCWLFIFAFSFSVQGPCFNNFISFVCLVLYMFFSKFTWLSIDIITLLKLVFQRSHHKKLLNAWRNLQHLLIPGLAIWQEFSSRWILYVFSEYNDYYFLLLGQKSVFSYTELSLLSPFWTNPVRAFIMTTSWMWNNQSLFFWPKDQWSDFALKVRKLKLTKFAFHCFSFSP